MRTYGRSLARWVINGKARRSVRGRDNRAPTRLIETPVLAGRCSRPCRTEQLLCGSEAVVTERGLALGLVAGHQAGHPDLGHPIGPGYLPLGPALRDDSGDDQTRLRYRPAVPAGVFLCLATRHSHVLRLGTAGGTLPGALEHSQRSDPPELRAGGAQSRADQPARCDRAGRCRSGAFVPQLAPVTDP